MTLEIPLRKSNLDQKGILIWNELSNHLSNTLQTQLLFSKLSLSELLSSLSEI